jgi:hypothetical protein
MQPTMTGTIFYFRLVLDLAAVVIAVMKKHGKYLYNVRFILAKTIKIPIVSRMNLA